MEEEKSIKEEVKEMKEAVKSLAEATHTKKFRLPFKARVSKIKQRKGWVTIQLINENKSIEFRKEPIINNTIKIDDTVHAIESEDVLSYRGKPFIIQAKKKLNPYNPLNGKNETYGQKYVMARLIGDVIKPTTGFKSSFWIIVLLAAAGGALWYFLA